MSGPVMEQKGGATVRSIMADGLRDKLGKGWIIFPGTTPINTISKPTITMIRQQLIKLPQAPMDMFQSTYKLMVISDQLVAESREDYLDGLLDDVLEALEDIGNLWSLAERDTFNGTNPAYIVTLTANNQRNRSTTT